MAGNAEISWPHLRMRIGDNASFAHGFRILRYTHFVNLSQDKILMKLMYTLFQMSDRRFMFRWEEIKIVRVKRVTFFNFIENAKFPTI